MTRFRRTAVRTLLLAGVAPFAGCTGERRDAAVPAPPAAVPAPAVADTTRPDVLRIAMRDRAPVLELPGPMRDALRAYAPGYTPWRLQDYDTEVAARARGSGALPLFGAIGDFNGDGVPDLVLQGHDATNELSFVILSNQRKFTVIELLRQPLPPEPRSTKRRIYAQHMGPGKIDVPTGFAAQVGPPPTLTTDAFAEVVEGEAGTLYYWKDGKFVQYPLGD